MSMYQGMDLSRFKKIASDGKVSTLRHSRGHEIKIAHSGLSPKMREHLDTMPVHLAEGGDPAAIDPESPAEVTEEDLYPPEESVPTEAPQTEPLQTEAPRTLPPKPEVMPVAGTVDVVGQRPATAPTPEPVPEPTIAEDLDNEGATFADDVQRGHIHPKTMSDLFAEKDTLGKIGTIFGLMIGGAGAGLTHQPNALLEMMQKEIDRDLDAQKTSNANSQNWLKLSHEYQMQKGQRQKLAADTLATLAETSKVPSQIAETEARARGIDADAQLKTYEAAKTRMMIGALSSIGGLVDKMPPGATKESAIGAYDMLKSAAATDIKARNQRTQNQIELRDAVRGKTKAQEPVDDGTGVDLRKMRQLRAQGAMLEASGAPGIGGMSASQEATAREEAAHVAQNRAISKMFVDAFNRLDSKAIGGALNPGERDAEIASLSAQLAQQYGAATQKEYDIIVRSMFPGATDWGGTRETKFRHGLEALKAREAGTATLDMFGLKTPFPAYAREKKKAKKAEKGSGTATAGPAEGATGTSKSGKPIIFRNGKWTYK